jgi:hypothetical protein
MEERRIARQVAEWNPQGKRKHTRLVYTGKEEIRNNMQTRHLKDEECFD